MRIEAISTTSTLRMGLVGFPVAWPGAASDMPFGTIDNVQNFFFRDAKAGSDELYRVVFRNASVRVSREQLQNCQVTGTWTYDKTSPTDSPITITQIAGIRLGPTAWGLAHSVSIEPLQGDISHFAIAGDVTLDELRSS